MSEISVKIDDKDVLNLLSLMKKRGLNMRTPFREASYIMHADVIQRFETESDEKGKKWAPLSPLTIIARMKKRKRTTSVGLLKDTGRLRQSIRPTSNDFGAEVKTNLEYAAIHNYGGTIKIPARERTLNFKVNKNGQSRFAKLKHANFQQTVQGKAHAIKMPARPFMRGLSDEATGKIIKLLQVHLFINRD